MLHIFASLSGNSSVCDLYGMVFENKLYVHSALSDNKIVYYSDLANKKITLLRNSSILATNRESPVPIAVVLEETDSYVLVYGSKIYILSDIKITDWRAEVITVSDNGDMVGPYLWGRIDGIDYCLKIDKRVSFMKRNGSYEHFNHRIERIY